jgi:predicted dehydrogenase
MEKHVNIGIIGCGFRIRGLLKQGEGIRVVAVCDPHPDSIAAARKEYGQDFRVFERYEDLVADPGVDWVVVGSWNSQHCGHAMAALRAGKHVFCEKPLATTLDDCLAIREAARESGRMFSFGLVLRYSPFYRKIHELLRAGTIGALISFEFNETINFWHGCYIMGGWRRLRQNAGTHLLEKCCHDMDIAIWLTESLPVRVASFGGLNFFRPENQAHTRYDEQGREIHTTWPGHHLLNPFTSEKDIVDNQVVILEYASGVRASFHANCCSGIPERRMCLIGTEGAIRADALTGIIEVQRISTTPEMQRYDTNVADGHPGGHAGGDEVLMESLCRSMRAGEAPLVGVEEGIKSAVVSFAIDEAMDTGTVVNLNPLWARVNLKEPQSSAKNPVFPGKHSASQTQKEP